MKLIDELKIHFPNKDWNVPVFIADEIAAQLDALEGEYENGFSTEFYGCVAPPFPRFWIEATTSSDEERGGKNFYIPKGTLKKGLLCEVVTEKNLPFRVPREVHWIVSCKNYGLVRVEHKPTGYVSWDAVMYWFMDKEGYLVGDPDKIMVDIFDPDMKKHDDIAEGLAGLAPFALKAISYLHQNGEVEEVTPSRQQCRKMQRTYKIEPTKHYILKVGQVHGRSIQESDIGKPVKQKRRKGIVRGHFKFYGSEYGRGKLFGKYEGAIFIPAHERGDDTVGRIQKDYKISGNSANS